jgi:hypothetical protein
MTNGAVCQAIDQPVYKDVYWAVYGIVFRAGVADKDVYWAVYLTVADAVKRAVYRAVADAVEEDPPHAAIELYLVAVT